MGIQISRLADQVHELLRDRILARDLPPGARLSVPVLAAELATSRSPVREAVQRLVNEGLATERPNHGAIVAVADLRVVAEMYEVRAPLDGLAAQLITGQEDPPIQAMRDALQLHAEAFRIGDVGGIIRADMAFHGVIARNCGNRELWAVLEPINQRVALAIIAGEPKVWPREALREHQDIVRAIESGDPQLARHAAEGHILLARRRILDKLATQDGDRTAGAPVGGL